MNEDNDKRIAQTLEMLKGTQPLKCPACKKSEGFSVKMAHVSNDRGQELYGNLFIVCAGDKCGAVIGPYNPAPLLPH